MYLHEDREQFDNLIIQAAEWDNNIDIAFVEKDYFIFLILKGLNEKLPTLLFKGGTSLSKCYKLINRFSEDLDISLAQEKISDRPRKRVKEAIKATCSELGLVITNLDKTQSDRDYNRYEIDYFPSHKVSFIKPLIYIETVYMVKNFSWQEMSISSILGDFLISQGLSKEAIEYGLEPFTITTQSLTRTLVDKIFAFVITILKINQKD